MDPDPDFRIRIRIFCRSESGRRKKSPFRIWTKRPGSETLIIRVLFCAWDNISPVFFDLTPFRYFKLLKRSTGILPPTILGFRPLRFVLKSLVCYDRLEVTMWKLRHPPTVQIWTCESWSCLQTIRFQAAAGDSQPVRLKAAMDASARYHRGSVAEPVCFLPALDFFGGLRLKVKSRLF